MTNLDDKNTFKLISVSLYRQQLIELMGTFTFNGHTSKIPIYDRLSDKLSSFSSENRLGMFRARPVVAHLM